MYNGRRRRKKNRKVDDGDAERKIIKRKIREKPKEKETWMTQTQRERERKRLMTIMKGGRCKVDECEKIQQKRLMATKQRGK